MLIIPCVFWTKMQLEDEEQKSGTPRMRIITVVFQWFWWWQRSLYHGVIRNIDPGGDHSNIFAWGKMGSIWASAGGTRNFEPGGGHSNILCDHKFQESGILSFAGDQWQKSHEEFWGHTRENLVYTNRYEDSKLGPLVASNCLGKNVSQGIDCVATAIVQSTQRWVN